MSPGWHLAEGFTGFEKVRAIATGNGVRIAHLDTGYWPPQVSTPRHIRRDLGYNFYENNTNTTDPGTGGLLRNPGHGTATLAIVSGNTVDLIYQGKQYTGDLGGAPDAEVVPVRIGPSVIHFFSSAMALAMDYALGPTGDPANSNPANKCDVVTISHGGLPSESWADAVNNLYEAGVVVVAASGDNFSQLPTHLTVYPSAFNRVVTAVGATYDKTPYVTRKIGELQGNWGPDDVMDKAIAAYTPNVAWMLFRTTDGFDMDGAGTSASTPQIAAACALWIQLYGANYAAGWQRVEACRLALFRSADPGKRQRHLSRQGNPRRAQDARPRPCGTDPAGISGEPGSAIAGGQRLVSVLAAVTACGPARQRRGEDVRNRGSATRPPLHQPGTGRRLSRFYARRRSDRRRGSRGCANCSKPSRAFPTLSRQDCDLSPVTPAKAGVQGG